MLATGRSIGAIGARKSEIIDMSLSLGSSQCFDWADHPVNTLYTQSGATGGLIENIAIICGGKNETKLSSRITDDCYSITEYKSKLVGKMFLKRDSAASIVINGNTLWITGGRNYIASIYVNEDRTESLASTELVQLGGSTNGPDMPIPLCNHGMVAINGSYSIIIGGLTASWNPDFFMKRRNSTFYYEHGEQNWIDGPILLKERSGIAVGVLSDLVTSEVLVIVTGGIGTDNRALILTEILFDNQWNSGKYEGLQLHKMSMYSYLFMCNVILLVIWVLGKSPVI